jgi:hypothetical protein
MKTAVFWVAAPCSLVLAGVSEELTASIIRAHASADLPINFNVSIVLPGVLYVIGVCFN